LGVRAKIAGLATALTMAVSVGCLLELTRPINCGDGFLDTVAGEECEPGPEFFDDFKDACREAGLGNGDAACNPANCQLLLEEEECSTCGDNNATGFESCDGIDLRSQVCPSLEGLLKCNDTCDDFDLSSCEPCGDGVLQSQAGEECDFRRKCMTDGDCDPGQSCGVQSGTCTIAGNDILPVVSCEDLDPLATDLPMNKPYGSGGVTQDDCTTQCLYDRTSCNFCGDGIRDGEYNDLGPGGTLVNRPAEICDGADADPEALSEVCKGACSDNQNTTFEFGCDASCNDSCTGFDLPDEFPGEPDPVEDLGCCLAEGSSCAGNPTTPCCEDLQCQQVFDMMGQVLDLRCLPT
jgi:hypothetical protein